MCTFPAEVRQGNCSAFLFQLSYCEQAFISQSINTMFSHVCVFFAGDFTVLNGPQAYCWSAI